MGTSSPGCTGDCVIRFSLYSSQLVSSSHVPESRESFRCRSSLLTGLLSSRGNLGGWLSRDTSGVLGMLSLIADSVTEGAPALPSWSLMPPWSAKHVAVDEDTISM